MALLVPRFSCTLLSLSYFFLSSSSAGKEVDGVCMSDSIDYSLYGFISHVSNFFCPLYLLQVLSKKP